ncbi:MAG: L,D-transpeptidase family protein [Desulfuromonadales bacterium]|nr:L,D-transpeptidase family protein [Desulfuromonadales bacterium]
MGGVAKRICLTGLPVLMGLLLCLSALPAPASASNGHDKSSLVRKHHRYRFAHGTPWQVAGDRIDLGSLAAFYRQRQFAPVWIDGNGVRAEADQLIAELGRVEEQGLNLFAYHLPQILQRRSADAGYRLAELDLLLSDAYLRYCRDVRGGQSDPRKVDPDWHVISERLDHLDVLQQALSSGTFQELLGDLTPREPMYRQLRQALKRYRDIAARGGWPTVSPGIILKPGMVHPSVRRLRERLRVSGDFFSPVDGGDHYDLYLEIAVRNFQARHGLKVDGEIGPRTRAALNMPVGKKIRRILVNLERWRWMPRELPERHLLINMAAFELQAIENHESKMKMRVIVGKSYRSTPAFAEEMTHMVLNPYWKIPTKIAVEDLLPRINDNPGILAKLGIKVFDSWRRGARELDPQAVDWSQLGEDFFPLQLRQDPGPANALGRIKFIFPNQFAVYMHDTPHRHLFEKTVRTFSSGCIRVERPMTLAEYLMRGDLFWNDYALFEAVQSKENMAIALPEPVPVYLVYWTAWAERDGTVHFRNDVYERDESLISDLQRLRMADFGTVRRQPL